MIYSILKSTGNQFKIEMKLYNYLHYYILGSQSLFFELQIILVNFVTSRAWLHSCKGNLSPVERGRIATTLRARCTLDLLLRRSAKLKNILFLSMFNKTIIEFRFL